MIVVKNPPPELTPQFQAVEWTLVRPGVEEKVVVHQGLELQLIRTFCQDCRAPYPNMFIAKNWLWHTLNIKGWICLDCFEKRLGRPLDERDLNEESPCNRFILRTPPGRMPDDEWEKLAASRFVTHYMETVPLLPMLLPIRDLPERDDS